MSGAEPGLPDHGDGTDPLAIVAGWMLLGALALGLLALLPAGGLPYEMQGGLLALGAVGIWRWSWGGLHYLRARIYRRRVFPRLRAAAEAAPLPPAIFVVVTSYRSAPELSAAVYRRLLAEVARTGVPCGIVACVTDPADLRLLGRLFAAQPDLPEGTTLEVLAQDGTGKRAALAAALARVARHAPPPHAQLVLMDGDTLLPEGALARTCRVLAAMPDLAAVTTDNRPLVRGAAPTRAWYRLRMAQRDQLMCSMSLSGRLLVLTGRFSVFRMAVAATPGFAAAVERDVVQHWRLGRIPLVTGDDKSTWFATLLEGRRTLYLPDVEVWCAEELPRGHWFAATTALMRRWYGNMSRNNGRALALGPRHVGWFPWLCLLDQRVSPWTTLTGPAAVAAAALSHGPQILVAYALWVLATRTLLAFLLWTANGRVHPAFPLLLYYGQLVGAAIKIHAFFHPDRQGWNRQALGATAAGRWHRVLSNGYMAVSLGAFAVTVVALAGQFAPRDGHGRPVGLDAVLDARERPEDHLRIACGEPGARPCAAVTATPWRPAARYQ